ncbi:uncharacterized protein MELLADRAFT_66720 [Melampsora larici-populina 98AG31]|uniref:Family 31 glycosyltransferase n=1 Tax=Melampsora larici-populina (strain 98AG31 / pathotype 3-4-7) TaxID=747676 RepID=F4S0B3_MELLP|nr:uncharacterized protein MELLADRAFT_66720 [Melampsora larici-populina 98AG31]EGG01932.1 hypothetical protein MELLADRAFT_66720 [Melampsora larici-populina 98AG31]
MTHLSSDRECTVFEILSVSPYQKSFSVFKPTILMPSAQDFCPKDYRGVASTIVLRPTAVLLDSEMRTIQMPFRQAENFLPFANKSSAQIPVGAFPRLLNVILSRESSPKCSVYDIDTASFPEDLGLDPFHGTPTTFRPPVLMWGLATSAAGIDEALPLWKDWMKEDDHIKKRRKGSSALLLLSAEDAPETQEQSRSQISQSGLNIEMEVVHASHQARRYFALIRWLWYTTKDRTGTEEIDWYVLCDDDTYFLDTKSTRHGISFILARFQDPKSFPYLISSMNKTLSHTQPEENGVSSGSGIFISRELMRMMNLPGQWEACDEEFSEFSGDKLACSGTNQFISGPTIISWCAARALKANSLKDFISVMPNLHTLEVKGDAHGIFQAGWEFLSLYNFRTSFQFFPKSHHHVLNDEVETVKLIGLISRAIGSANWGRRFVWGVDSDENPTGESLVICLGFSITKYAAGVMDTNMLRSVEETFDSANLTSPIRPKLVEGLQKNTYFIADAQFLPAYSPSKRFTQKPVPEVLMMRYMNSDRETLDIIWDPRKHRN